MGTGVMPPLGETSPGEHAADGAFTSLRDEAANERAECEVRGSGETMLEARSRLGKDLGRSLPGSIFGPPPLELVF